MDPLIFVVDDSKTVRASLEYTLVKGGYEVAFAEDGMDGISQLENLKHYGKLPALIITDVNMPKMDGITFIQALKKNPAFQHVPILVMTTESEKELKIEGKKAGAAGWLVKPFNPEQLKNIVNKLAKSEIGGGYCGG